MIRRSTLVFLTCMAALGSPAMRTKSVAAAVIAQEPTFQALLAQANSSSGGLKASPLSLDSRGEGVKALQRRLRQSDYYNGSVDGIFGLDTRRAVIAFQADEGLAQTGTMTDETWFRLQSLSDQAPSVSSPSDSETQAQGAPSAAGQSESVVPSSTPGISVSSAQQPETSPTSGELPPVGGAIDNPDDVADPDCGGGLGKMLGFSLGLAALLSSFGVGFYMANRGKSEAGSSEDDEWGLAAGPTGLLPQRELNAAASTQSSDSASLQVVSNASRSNGNGTASGATSSITPAVVSSLHTGQMGGTSPLAKVDVIDGLIGDLRNADPTRRRKAIWELGQRGNSLAMQPLVDSMVNADSKEKSLVLAALSEIGIRSLKPMSRALAIALQDENPDVRKNAIRDITRVYDLVIQISQMLGHAVEDEDPEVRQTATWALNNLNRIRRSEDIDANMRTFSGSASQPIDLLSSEASLRRSSQQG